MARFTNKVESICPFEFCDRCGFFEEKIEKMYADSKRTLYVSCTHADVCLNAVRMAKEDEYEG